MSGGRAPTAGGPWWRDDGDPTQPVRVTSDLHWRHDYERHVRPVTDDGHWIAPVLTAEQASALTARAERAERERDEARHWAEDAAAAENDNAADLRAARTTLKAVRAYVDQLERIGWRDLTEQSPDIAHGMNCAGAQLRIILGGSHE